MALPAMRALVSMFPKVAQIVTVAGVQAMPFDELDVRQTRFPMTYSGDGYEFDAHELAQRIGECDLFISLVPWYSRGLKRLAELLKPAHSVGITGDYTTTVTLSSNRHAAHAAFDVARLIDTTASFHRYSARPRYPREARRFVSGIRQRLAANTRLVVVHGETTPAKQWPTHLFRHAVHALARSHPEVFIFVVGTASAAGLEQGSSAGRIIDFLGLPLPLSCALVANADLFLGVDSVMLHVADLARVPTVALFGPTDPTQFGCLFAPHRTLRPESRLLSDISVSEALRACEAMLSISK